MREKEKESERVGARKRGKKAERENERDVLKKGEKNDLPTLQKIKRPAAAVLDRR